MFWIALILLIVILAILASIYCKLTCGLCKCSRHLVGKVVVVTGANSGIGYETAKDFAERGARVIMACRNESRATTAKDKIIKLSGNSDVHYRHLELASLASVRKFVDEIIKAEKRLDILVNNAGIIEVDKVITEDGLLFAMQANHFGPFLLTSLLLPMLKDSAPSRIINVSSFGYRSGKIDFNNLNMEKATDKTYSRFQVYKNSKLCNILMTKELDRRLKGTGVTVNCLHPGMVNTYIMSSLMDKWYYQIIWALTISFIKNPWEGAQTTIYLAVSPEVAGVSGGYFSDCRQQRLLAHAEDADVAHKLWDVSKELVKLK